MVQLFLPLFEDIIAEHFERILAPDSSRKFPYTIEPSRFASLYCNDAPGISIDTQAAPTQLTLPIPGINHIRRDLRYAYYNRG